jgi:ketosteroid isomerase-like protein
VTLRDVIIGSTRLKKLRLPAVDLSAIGATCQGRIDGILGVDLLGRLGATIDLHHHTLRFASQDEGRDAQLISEMRGDMHRCLEAFQRFDEASLGDCLAPDIVLYTADADVHGRQRVLDYFRQRYIHPGSVAQLKLRVNAVHAIGRTAWSEYEFTLDAIRATLQGHGIAVCRKSEGRWQIVSMHDSALGSDQTASTEQ